MGSSLISFRAIMKDVFKGDHALAKASLIISSIVSLTPPLAPITGGFIQQYLGWRYNFILQFIMAIAVMILIIRCLNLEHIPKIQSNIFKGYKCILADKIFLLNAACSGLALSLVFIFVTLAPFLFQNVIGVSPSNYSLILALIIIPPAIVVMLSRFFIQKLKMHYVMLVCSVISIVGALLMVLSYFIFGLSLISIIITCIIIFSGNSLQYTASYVCAYKNIISYVGIASAIFGFIQVIVTSLISLAASMVHLNNQVYLGLLMMIPPILIIILKIINLQLVRSKNYKCALLTNTE